jgi:hypothetical protein
MKNYFGFKSEFEKKHNNSNRLLIVRKLERPLINFFVKNYLVRISKCYFISKMLKILFLFSLNSVIFSK